MSAIAIGVVFACLVVAALAAAAWANGELRTHVDRLRLLARPVPLPIQDLAPGMVTARGVVAKDGVTSAPVSGRPCVAYRVRIWGHDAEGGKSNAIAEIEGGVPFVIAQSDQRMHVALPERIASRFNPVTFTAYRRIAGARVLVEPSTTHRWAELTSEQKIRLCELAGWPPDTTIPRFDETSENMPIEEWIVGPGDDVVVSGSFEAPKLAADYRHAPAPGRVAASPLRPLLVVRM